MYYPKIVQINHIVPQCDYNVFEVPDDTPHIRYTMTIAKMNGKCVPLGESVIVR